MRRLLYRGLNSSVWQARLIERGWPDGFAHAFALFLTGEGPLPGWSGDDDENAIAELRADIAELLETANGFKQERDEAWARIDQLLGREP